jgi:hypothetical protein
MAMLGGAAGETWSVDRPRAVAVVRRTCWIKWWRNWSSNIEIKLSDRHLTGGEDMNEITKQRVLKILEGIPVDRQIRILKAAKLMARMRAEPTKDSDMENGYQPK